MTPVIRQQTTWVFIAGLAVGLFLLAGRPANTAPVLAQGEPPAMPLRDRLAPPPMPAHPTQADHGAQVYYLTCMSCHGDQGQGLTDEWRAAWGPEEQNCWQSRCHAANHPPDGFELPRYAPRVIGEGALVRFETAADLKGFICQRMPWQAPGTLDEASCWQLTAFLLRSNGRLPARIVPGAANGAEIRLPSEPDQPSRWLPLGFGLATPLVGLGAGTLLLLALIRRRARE